MYLDHFGLAVNPFSLSPKLEFLYKSGAFEESMAHLIYGVDNSEAIIMITGAIGTGKTMALQSFMNNLNQGFQWALVTNTQVTPTELLKLILEDLGVEFPPGCDKSDLLILFKDFLVKTNRSGQRVIVFIDEAQNMAREVLEEVRLLTNLGQGDIQPVQVILVGQPELETVVDRPDLAQLRQRIRVHYRLDPLSRKEVEEYINHRMSVAGCGHPAFKSGAIDRIAEYSGGVPRLVNSLAGKALLSAFVAGRKKVDTLDVEAPEGIAPDMHSNPGASNDPVSSAGPATPPPPPAMVTDPHVFNRNAQKKSSATLIVTLVVILVAMALIAMYLRGDLQKILNNVWPRESAPVVMVAKAETASASLDEGVTSDPDPAPLDSLAASQDDHKAETSVPPRGNYYVQVASFKTMERAKRCCRNLHAKGFQTLIKDQQVSGLLWQRVLIGPYPDRTAAEAGLLQYKQPQKDDYFPISVVDSESGS